MMSDKMSESLEDGTKRSVFASWLLSSHCAAVFVGILLVAISAAAQINMTTSRYNNQRTSVNSNETVLTPANVNATGFGKLFSQAVDGYVYAQPLYVSNLTIGGSVHNVVFVATEHDSVYAFDADSNSGANAQPLWHTSFLSSGVTTVPNSVLGNDDINPEIGVTGTPVIDVSTSTLYVVGETLENNGTNFVKKLHALDITTGAEKAGSPIAISASVTVSGQATVTFDVEGSNQRPGLLLYNGVVYIGFAAHGDGNYLDRGWILGYLYNGTTFSQVFVFCDEPSSAAGAGGIWMSGQGLAMDSGSNMFVATGNGQFDTNLTPPLNYGDSIIRIDLSKGPTVQDYFTPSDQASLNAGDNDLGSGGVAILPDQSGANPHLLVQAGKEGTIYVINRDNMGHYDSSRDNIVQEIVGGTTSLFGSPVYFNGKVYIWGYGAYLVAYTVTNGTLSTSPTDVATDIFYYPGATPTISANGTSNAILWALREDAFSSTGPGGPAVLYAYDAYNLSAGTIFRSDQNSTRDNPGGAIKFAVPTVANGKVYVGAEGQLSVYGELGAGGGTAPSITSANSTTFTEGTAGSFTVTATGSPTPSLIETGTLPSGVTFVDNGNGTAALSGTPATGTAGTYAITIKAHNGVGTDASQNFTLTVNSTGGGGSSNFAYVTGSVTGVFNSGATSSTTLSVNLHQTPGFGDLLVCAATWQSGTATASVSDSNNGTWKAIGAAKPGVGGLTGYSGQMFYVPSAVGASTTVTLTTSSATVFRSLECVEYSYAGTIAALDGTPQYSTTPVSGGVATISGLTTSNSGDLVLAACIAVDTSCVGGSGYTIRDDTKSLNVANGSTNNSFIGITGQTIEDKVGIIAGAQSGTFGTGTSSDNVILGLLAMTATTTAPDFSISASPASQSVVQGGNVPYTVSVGALNGFSGTVNLSVSGLPSGATLSFVPTSVNGSGSSTLTVTTSASTPVGTYLLTITGASSTLSHSVTVTLSVNSPSSTPTVTAISPTSGTTAGGSPVNITGTGFQSGATVTLGGTTATNVNVVSSTSITATTPAHTVGAVNVVVTNTDGQTGTLSGGFTYIGAISFVQASSGPSTLEASNSSVAVSYPSAQTAGDLNIVVVGCGDNTSSISSVTDSRGNSYSLAVGPTSNAGLQQSIYYAQNIASGSNTVTVKFNQAASYPDVRILEYSGLNTSSPLDGKAAANGSGTMANSGPATTTSASELIFGAGTTGTAFSAAGSGFFSRIINIYGNIAEDIVVTSTGSYSAMATTSSSVWVMQVATFK